MAGLGDDFSNGATKPGGSDQSAGFFPWFSRFGRPPVECRTGRPLNGQSAYAWSAQSLSSTFVDFH